MAIVPPLLLPKESGHREETRAHHVHDILNHCTAYLSFAGAVTTPDGHERRRAVRWFAPSPLRTDAGISEARMSTAIQRGDRFIEKWSNRPSYCP